MLSPSVVPFQLGSPPLTAGRKSRTRATVREMIRVHKLVHGTIGESLQKMVLANHGNLFQVCNGSRPTQYPIHRTCGQIKSVGTLANRHPVSKHPCGRRAEQQHLDQWAPLRQPRPVGTPISGHLGGGHQQSEPRSARAQLPFQLGLPHLTAGRKSRTRTAIRKMIRVHKLVHGTIGESLQKMVLANHGNLFQVCNGSRHAQYPVHRARGQIKSVGTLANRHPISKHTDQYSRQRQPHQSVGTPANR